MQFLASIIPNSVIDKSWRCHRRIGGDVATVRFTLIGNIFVSGPLTADQIAQIQQIPSVRLEALAHTTLLTEPPQTKKRNRVEL